MRSVMPTLMRTLMTTGAHMGGWPALPRRIASTSRKMLLHSGHRYAPARPRRPTGSIDVPSFGHAIALRASSVTVASVIAPPLMGRA